VIRNGTLVQANWAPEVGTPTGLYAGGTADVVIVVKQLPDVLTVPTAAIHTVNGETVLDVTVTGHEGDPVRRRTRTAREAGHLHTSRHRLRRDRPTEERRTAQQQHLHAPSVHAGPQDPGLAAHSRGDQALFGIIQGGVDPELRARSTEFIASMPFDGLCIGGLAGDETPVQRADALEAVIPLLVDDPRPRYLMGLGSPADLLDAVCHGVDLFDSVLPARVARNGQLWVPGGRLNLRNSAFLDDPRPVQEDCPCRACRRFSRAYLAHLFRAKELLAYRLATCHNLTFTLDFMARIRSALRAGTFPDSLAELQARASHVTRDAAGVEPA
jgi:hypothetical protein